MLAYAFSRAPERMKPAWARHLHGWQKVFGIVALLMALLIILNPEFLALGLLGDISFFDVLVLVLSLQLQSFVVRAWHFIGDRLARTRRWLGIPSPGLRYELGVWAVMIGSAASAVQKIIHRLDS